MTALAAALRDELARLLEPIASAAGSDDRVTMILDLVGQGAGASDPHLRAAFDNLAALADAVGEIEDAELGSWEGLDKVLRASAAATTALHNLESSFSDPQLAARFEGLGEELTGQLVSLYLRRYRPRAFRIACLLTLIDPHELSAPQPEIVDGSTELRSEWLRDEFRLDRIDPLVHRMWATLAEVYFPNRLATAMDARVGAGRLFAVLGSAAEALGLAWATDDRSLLDVVPVDPNTDPDLGDHFDATAADPAAPEPDRDPAAYYVHLQPRLAVAMPKHDDAGAITGAGLALVAVASSADQPGDVTGLTFAIAGEAAWSETRGHWKLDLASDGQIPVFVVGPDGLKVAPSTSPQLGARARLSVTRLPDMTGAPAIVFGSATGTRVELGHLKAEADLALAPSASSIALDISASSGKLVVAPADGDGFLRAILPADGFTVAFDAGLAVSSARGLELTGAVGLEAQLPTHLSLGPLGAIDELHLRLSAADGGLQGEVSCAATLTLGPARLAVERLGLVAALTTPAAGGNFGVAEFEVGFRAPGGIGLVLDAGVVTGGGFLRFDPAQESYGGSLEASLALCGKGVQVKAEGLLRTTGGEWSLVVVLSAQFEPAIEIFLGLTLEAVGGIVGVNVGIDLPKLRSGLHDGAIGGLLFPEDPVADAPKVMATLGSVFPVRRGGWVAGPMFRLGWGRPKPFLTLSVAAVLAGPAPVSLDVLGRLAVAVPDPAVVDLKADFLGTISFAEPSAAFDASLIDSRIAGFPLTGDLAMRAGPAGFILAIGGVNPRFTPPQSLPVLRRIALDVSANAATKVRAEAYLAVTSNTFQIGLHAALDFDAGPASLHGWLDFDALIRWEPRFQFSLQIKVGLELRIGGDAIAGVSADLLLEGPGPWHAKGSASLDLFFFSISVGFERTWGEIAAAEAPPELDAAQQAAHALSGEGALQPIAPDGDAIVSFRASARPQVGAHPDGQLGLRQQALPLGIAITRIGRSHVAGGIATVNLTPLAGTAHTAPTTALFAVSESEDLSDDEKLSRPSFEPFQDGIAFGAAPTTISAAQPATAAYETVFIPEQQHRNDPLDPRLLIHALQHGAVARSGLHHAQQFDGPDQHIRLTPPTYRIVNADTLTSTHTTPGDYASATAAHTAATTAPTPVLIVEAHEVMT